MTRGTRVEVKLAGLGGQGIVLAGRILALGAFYDGKWVVCTQAYSARVRGAPVEADVIISDERVAYPFVRRPDILVALAEPGLRFTDALREDGLLIADKTLENLLGDVRARKLVFPLARTAERELGFPGLINMVALGALVGSTGLVSVNSMERAISESVGERYLEADLKAFRAGLRLASR